MVESGLGTAARGGSCTGAPVGPSSAFLPVGGPGRPSVRAGQHVLTGASRRGRGEAWGGGALGGAAAAFRGATARGAGASEPLPARGRRAGHGERPAAPDSAGPGLPRSERAAGTAPGRGRGPGAAGQSRSGRSRFSAPAGRDCGAGRVAGTLGARREGRRAGAAVGLWGCGVGSLRLLPKVLCAGRSPPRRPCGKSGGSASGVLPGERSCGRRDRPAKHARWQSPCPL